MTSLTYPEVVVFDLDYTLWPLWVDYHVQLPVRALNDRVLKDASGFEMSLFPDVEGIIEELHENGVTIIGASRTPTPHIAKELLKKFKISGRPMMSYFDTLQWGEGTKIKHIKKGISELGLDKALNDGSVILFDDEFRNRDVTSINCYFAYIEDYRSGLTRKIFEEALKDLPKVLQSRAEKPK